MTLTIPDNILKEAGLTEGDALIEFACRLFESGKLPLWPASKLARLSRGQMEDELLKRGIAVYKITSDYLRQELESLDRYAKAGG